jgi:hypothetical protein
MLRWSVLRLWLDSSRRSWQLEMLTSILYNPSKLLPLITKKRLSPSDPVPMTSTVKSKVFYVN